MTLLFLAEVVQQTSHSCDTATAKNGTTTCLCWGGMVMSQPEEQEWQWGQDAGSSPSGSRETWNFRVQVCAVLQKGLKRRQEANPCWMTKPQEEWQFRISPSRGFAVLGVEFDQVGPVSTNSSMPNLQPCQDIELQEGGDSSGTCGALLRVVQPELGCTWGMSKTKLVAVRQDPC